MTQTRLPLFTTGIPQIVPSAALDANGLDILDLRDQRPSLTDVTRLVSLWLNYSALIPVPSTTQDVSVYIQIGTDTPVLITKATIDHGGGPLKVLDNYALRGNVRLFLLAESADLNAGSFAVAWGYYSVEGDTPQKAMMLRPLQPDPDVIPETCGMSLTVDTDGVPLVLHTVSDTQIDQIRLEAYPVPLSPDVGTGVWVLCVYFGNFSLSTPFALGQGFVTLAPALYSTLTKNTSGQRRYFDGIPFRGAGEMIVEFVSNAIVPLHNNIQGSFTRTT